MAEKGGRLKVFSTIRVVLQHILVLILLLSFALDNIVDGCVPVETRWTGMCQVECQVGLNERYVELSDCNATSLDEVSHSRGGDEISVTFTSSGITTVSRRAFSGYNVEDLYLHNSFVNFEPGAFEGLTVKYICITNNHNLKSVPSGVFSGVKNLEKLILSVNYNLQSVPANIVQGLTRLKSLHLSDNRIHSVPDGLFQGLTRLEELDLSNNEIKSVAANMYQGLQNLKILFMHGNSISCFPPELFQPLQSLEELRMNQKVNITGLCPQSFKDVGVNGGGCKVEEYNVKIDRCIAECGYSVEGLKITESNETCDCGSYEGCIDCVTGEPAQPPSPTGDLMQPPSPTGDLMQPPSPTGDLMQLPSSTGDPVQPPSPTGDLMQPPITTGEPVQPPITTGDPVQPPIPPTAGGVQALKADATWGIILMVTPVMILVRKFDC